MNQSELNELSLYALVIAAIFSIGFIASIVDESKHSELEAACNKAGGKYIRFVDEPSICIDSKAIIEMEKK